MGGAVFDDDVGEAPLAALPDFAPPEAGASPPFLSCRGRVRESRLGGEKGERKKRRISGKGRGRESPRHKEQTQNATRD